MQSFLRVSVALSYSRRASKITQVFNLKVLSFSVNHSTLTPRISLPDRDYSVNSEVARSNSLVTRLCREGNINEARHMFDKMLERDVVTWTAVITGYIKCGLIAEARRLFDRTDAIKNVVTWTAMVSGYMRLNRISEAERLFEAMPMRNVVSWNTMIVGYCQNRKVGKALEMFERMPERNVVSWNTVITALSQCGQVDEAKRLFDEMPKRDVISWTAMVAGLARNSRVDDAREIFDRMPEKNVVSWNAMVTGYAKNMRLVEAFELFEKMPERDLPSWNTMITGFIQNHELKQARKLFNHMPEKNVVSWTTMITGYVQEGESEAALKIFMEMVRDGRAKPNEGTFVNVLGACSDSASLGEGQQVHQMISKTVYQDMPFVISALISMYSKCGELDMARKMFNDGVTSQRDLVSWNGMVAAYAHHGNGMEAIKLFNEMKGLGFKPDDVSYVGLLSACSHAGLVEEGLSYFEELTKDKSIQVREDHYTCLIDLCGRAGRLREALDLVKQLGIKSSSSIWAALLAGCNVHGDLKIGKLAAQELSKKEPENAGSYMLLSSIYASSGKWKEAARVRSEMNEKGLKKQPGCSWIEIENRVHVFLARDKSHSQSNLIYSLLNILHAKMKKIGSESHFDFLDDQDFSVS
ncbi:pentatricopeptide repeat-containing protein At2g35030, mitochondrial [Mercurialis annua]|uniref:pentatricopeptide repeat-containing protein At2g35030, mitochondrial n=1 Tax=Mercurialis annua TaxID=3986 RepID=UPI00215F9244|nr:pentatricopeptide repeat-containing protein At2g35030, mitochondrial [Mercurialis annua]